MFTLLAVGSLKEPWWRAATEEYLKRLQPYAPVRIIEVPETPFAKKDDHGRVTKTEAARLIKYLKPRTHVVALSPAGTAVSARAFKEKFSTWRSSPEVLFIIGGPLGLHESILERAHETISLSPLTFTHQMVRVFLLEQFYRAIMREKNKYDY